MTTLSDLTDQLAAIEAEMLTPADGGANTSDIRRDAYMNVHRAIKRLVQADAADTSGGFS